MTTIAYKHPYIACDTRVTANGVIVNDKQVKHYTHDGWISFVAGASCDAEEFASNVMNQESDLVYDCSSISVSPDGHVYNVVQLNEGNYCRYKIDKNLVYAIGSGSDFALSAMDLGRGALESVEYAMTRDIYTGGDIIIFNVETGEME